MEERVLIKGEFDKKVLFTRGIFAGLLGGALIFIIAGVVLPMFLGFIDTVYITTVGISSFVFIPIVTGSTTSKQKHELLITDTKLTASIGNNVLEFPLDSITSFDVGVGALRVEAPPRKFTVVGLKNIDEIAQFLNRYFNEKQSASRVEPKKPELSSTYSGADELKKYKELLDMGVITQEEFNQKKRELLGL